MSVAGMGNKLRVEFGDPQHGWMAMTIRSDASVVALTVSSVLYDTLDELVDGLRALTTGDDHRSVRIFEEPTSCELQFNLANGTMGLKLCRFDSHSRRSSRKPGQRLFETAGSGSEICLPFWRALRNLQTRFSAEEFRLWWHRHFPESGMEKLGANLRHFPR